MISASIFMLHFASIKLAKILIVSSYIILSGMFLFGSLYFAVTFLSFLGAVNFLWIIGAAILYGKYVASEFFDGILLEKFRSYNTINRFYN